MHRIRFSYIIVLLITFSFTLLVGGPMPYFLFYISLLVFLIPLIHLLLSLIGIEASVKLAKDHLYVGDKVDMEYKIKNKNFFSIPRLKFKSNINKKLVGKDSDLKTISLGVREEFKGKENIPLNRRGFYESIALTIKVSDVYSIFNLKKAFNSRVNLLVYPKIIKLDSFRVYSNKDLGEILVEKSIFKDKSSISSIDEYRKGDSINQIHWKASAKQGSPMIKNFDTVSGADLNIFLNNEQELFKGDIDKRIEDKIVEVSIALVNFFLNLDIDIGLNTFSGKEAIEIKNKNKDELRVYLEVLARFKANASFGIKNLIEDKLYSFAKNSIVLIITPILDEDLGILAISLKIKNLIPIFIMVSDKKYAPPRVDKNIEKKLKKENIDIYFIDYSSNIKEELEIRYG